MGRAGPQRVLCATEISKRVSAGELSTSMIGSRVVSIIVCVTYSKMCVLRSSTCLIMQSHLRAVAALVRGRAGPAVVAQLVRGEGRRRGRAARRCGARCRTCRPSTSRGTCRSGSSPSRTALRVRGLVARARARTGARIGCRSRTRKSAESALPLGAFDCAPQLRRRRAVAAVGAQFGQDRCFWWPRYIAARRGALVAAMSALWVSVPEQSSSS